MSLLRSQGPRQSRMARRTIYRLSAAVRGAMKVIIDRKKIGTRQKLSNFASLGGLLLLLVSVVLPLIDVTWNTYSTIIMVIGLAMAMIGIYFANRWVKKPRPEALLDETLINLHDTYRLYHYPALPCDHVMLTPGGVVVLETNNLEGKFSYKNGRWREKIGLGKVLRYLVEVHLGNPIRSAMDDVSYLKDQLSVRIPGGETIPVWCVVVFVHPRAVLEIEGAEIPVCKVEKLRKHVTARSTRLPPQLYEGARKVIEGVL
ncbi:MAG: hypothetical protein A2W33_02770 [Chloroflexi bacterium RBG_16_52_11]|nr:MAG: hypothetical protein A2W33_02770 [Chloroflexi bacterium RBG_16_52_11]